MFKFTFIIATAATITAASIISFSLLDGLAPDKNEQYFDNLFEC